MPAPQDLYDQTRISFLEAIRGAGYRSPGGLCEHPTPR